MNENILLPQHPSVYPYIETRVVPTLYHITVLPELEYMDAVDVLREQYSYNKLDSCLVAGPDRALYISKGGVEALKRNLPSGGFVITEKLKSVIERNTNEDFEILNTEYLNRIIELKEYIESMEYSGYMMGDLTKGGHEVTELEQILFDGLNENEEGVPKGLLKCDTCGYYKGLCLDPGKNFKNQVMEVSCLCDNDNLCALCEKTLHKHKLNANYFEPKDGQIWHVPGFSGLSHRCYDQLSIR